MLTDDLALKFQWAAYTSPKADRMGYDADIVGGLNNGRRT
ncbi:Hypothetical protein RY67_1330 [Bifidobacterium longum subsp. infantis]|uniref:Uncharacterized protein n=1 Tax=Bifidobacterium longum subsp. infantis TaxID=1682 RepID=A0A0M4LI63_BIFLI|nr:Hypothetical protein RY67_1330 [Bifidobacterium longum subsp. infantis]